jgi:hypothetical protein
LKLKILDALMRIILILLLSLPSSIIFDIMLKMFCG